MPQDLSRSTVLGADSVAEEDLEAYRANYETFRTGISTEECIESYNRNAEKYEQVNSTAAFGNLDISYALRSFKGINSHEYSIR